MSAEHTIQECLEFFDDVLITLRTGFAVIEDIAPKPSLSMRSGSIEVRYAEPSIELAFLLKLARGISLLSALRVMVERGLVQEQGILSRAIDETDEDILFLSLGHQNGIEEIHRTFLEAFWAEEFEDGAPLLGNKRRQSIPRKKIEAFISRTAGIPDPSTAQSVSRLLQGTFSGYVHGASTHILDLYDPNTQRFSVSGLGNTPVRRSYVTDSANYPYRVLMSAIIVARRLGLQAVAEGFYSKLGAAEKFIRLPDHAEAAAISACIRPKKS